MPCNVTIGECHMQSLTLFFEFGLMPVIGGMACTQIRPWYFCVVGGLTQIEKYPCATRRKRYVLTITPRRKRSRPLRRLCEIATASPSRFLLVARDQYFRRGYFLIRCLCRIPPVEILLVIGYLTFTRQRIEDKYNLTF